MRRWAVVLLLLFLTRCSTPTKEVRLDTGQGEPRIHVLRRDVEPVKVDDERVRLKLNGSPAEARLLGPGL